jgi:hypothetical protein
VADGEGARWVNLGLSNSAGTRPGRRADFGNLAT